MKKISPERPGFDVGEPVAQHFVLASLNLIHTLPPEDRPSAVLHLSTLADELYGWDLVKFREYLRQGQRIMIDYRGRFTFWFTEDQWHFDYNVDPPKS
jgi:hypothetical protein